MGARRWNRFGAPILALVMAGCVPLGQDDRRADDGDACRPYLVALDASGAYFTRDLAKEPGYIQVRIDEGRDLHALHESVLADIARANARIDEARGALDRLTACRRDQADADQRRGRDAAVAGGMARAIAARAMQFAEAEAALAGDDRLTAEEKMRLEQRRRILALRHARELETHAPAAKTALLARQAREMATAADNPRLAQAAAANRAKVADFIAASTALEPKRR